MNPQLRAGLRKVVIANPKLVAQLAKHRANQGFRIIKNRAGHSFTRVKHGDETPSALVSEDFVYSLKEYKPRCSKCNTKIGEYHILGCCFEQCPRCENWLATCRCFAWNMDATKDLIQL